MAEMSQDSYNSKSLEELESMYNSISSKKSRSKYMSKNSDYMNCEIILERVNIAKNLKIGKTLSNEEDVRIDRIFSIDEINRRIRNVQSKKSIANSMNRMTIVNILEEEEKSLRIQKDLIIQTNRNMMNYFEIQEFLNTLKSSEIQNSQTDAMILAIEMILRIQ